MYNYQAAQQAYSRYLITINNLLVDVKKNLSVSSKTLLSYPKWLDGYQVDQWCELPVPEKRQVEQWAEPLVFEKVPEPLHEYVAVDIEYKTQFVPYVQYEVQGIPCLDWWFKTLMVVGASIRTKAMTLTKTFHGCDFNLEMNSGLLGEVSLGPCLWENSLGMVTPLALLLMVARGEMEELGIQVIEREPPLTTFDIEGFDEAITIHDSFMRFIRDVTVKQPLHQALLRKQLIDAGTFHILEARIGTSSEKRVKANELGKPQMVAKVVEKMVSLGWTGVDAKNAVSTTKFPPGASIEEMISIVLKKYTK